MQKFEVCNNLTKVVEIELEGATLSVLEPFKFLSKKRIRDVTLKMRLLFNCGLMSFRMIATR